MERDGDEDLRKFIKAPEQDLSATLKCPICFNFYDNPVTCCEGTDPQCNFCKTCLEGEIYLKDDGGRYCNKNCPLCFRNFSDLTNLVCISQ